MSFSHFLFGGISNVYGGGGGGGLGWNGGGTNWLVEMYTDFDGNCGVYGGGDDDNGVEAWFQVS